MAWLYVLAAGAIEILWVLGLKHAASLSAYLAIAALIAVSFYVLAKAFEYLPVGVVYAVFTGIGTAGIVLVEWLFVDHQISPLKLLCILAIMGGVIGLKLSTESGGHKGG